jgi:hypothetical protein
VGGREGRKEEEEDEEEETQRKLILGCGKFIGCAAEFRRHLKDLNTS